jgi:hypothetical protein
MRCPKCLVFTSLGPGTTRRELTADRRERDGWYQRTRSAMYAGCESLTALKVRLKVLFYVTETVDSNCVSPSAGGVELFAENGLIKTLYSPNYPDKYYP